MNTEVLHRRMAVVNWKVKDPPCCFICTYVPAQLKSCDLISPSLFINSKDCLTASLVHILADILHRLYRTSELNIDVRMESFAREESEEQPICYQFSCPPHGVLQRQQSLHRQVFCDGTMDSHHDQSAFPSEGSWGTSLCIFRYGDRGFSAPHGP